MNNQEITKKLNQLIIKLKDADKGLHTAAQEVRDTNLRTQLHQFAQQQATIWGDLQSEVRRLGGEPQDSGSKRGHWRNMWMEIKTAFTKNDESVVLKDCHQFQDQLKHQIHDLLNCPELPAHLKHSLNDHHERICEITNDLAERQERFESIQSS